MKKLALIALFAFSTVAFANEEAKTETAAPAEHAAEPAKAMEGHEGKMEHKGGHGKAAAHKAMKKKHGHGKKAEGEGEAK